MTADYNNSEADNEVPPVARLFGRAVSEWISYSMIFFCVIAVIVGSVVGGERDVQAERAMATLAALTESAENRAAQGASLICDERLLDPALLENDYLTLSVSKAPVNEDDKSLGYGPALYISVVEKEVSGDTWDTAKRVKELVEEAGKKETELNKEADGRVQGEGDAAESENPEDKPKNRLREVREKSYGETEEYLRYYILASESARCS